VVGRLGGGGGRGGGEAGSCGAAGWVVEEVGWVRVGAGATTDMVAAGGG